MFMAHSGVEGGRGDISRMNNRRRNHQSFAEIGFEENVVGLVREVL